MGTRTATEWPRWSSRRERAGLLPQLAVPVPTAVPRVPQLAGVPRRPARRLPHRGIRQRLGLPARRDAHVAACTRTAACGGQSGAVQEARRVRDMRVLCGARRRRAWVQTGDVPGDAPTWIAVCETLRGTARTRRLPASGRRQVGLACSPKTDPAIMRVFGPAAAWSPPGQEALDEKDETQSGTDHCQAA